MQPLYLEPKQSFEKLAVAGKVGESPELWPSELLDLFYEQHPGLADAEAMPVLKDVNEERGYAVGSMEVKKKPVTVPRDVDPSDVVKSIRFPFVIRNKEVSPFDIFVVGETIHPATARNVEKALLSPEVFDIVRTMPGDVSMVNQLYPPYRSRYGFGTSFESGAGGKFATVGPEKLPSMLAQISEFASDEDVQRILTALDEDPSLKKMAQSRHPFTLALQTITEEQTPSVLDMREARRFGLAPDVIQFTKEGHKVRVKFSNSQMYSPQETELTIKEAAEMLPQPMKAKLMAEGGVTVSTDPVVREDFEENKAVEIKNTGVYEIKCSDKDSDLRNKNAVVYTSVVDLDMTALPVTLAIFFDGSWAMQDRIAGKPAPEQKVPAFLQADSDNILKIKDYLPESPDDAARPRSSDKAYGMVDKDIVMPKLGTVVFRGDGVVTIPLTVKSVRIMAKGVAINTVDVFGQPRTLYPGEGIKKIIKVGPSAFSVPDNLQVIPLGSVVKCVENPDEYVKISSVLTSLEIVSDGRYYTFRNHPSLLKLGSDTSFLLEKDALFLAASMGLSVPYATKMIKQAARMGSVVIPGVRAIVTEAEKLASAQKDLAPLIEKIESMRHFLLKEAAELPGEDTVDKVLSLNFITPENVSLYVKNLASFQATATDLAQLLLATRIGLEEVPEAAVQRAMNSVQGVIEALEELKFNQPASTSA